MLCRRGPPAWRLGSGDEPLIDHPFKIKTFVTRVVVAAFLSSANSVYAARMDFIETAPAQVCGVLMKMFDGNVTFDPVARFGDHHIFPDEGRTIYMDVGGTFQQHGRQLTSGREKVYAEYERLAKREGGDPVFNEQTFAELRKIDDDPRVHGTYITRLAGRSKRVEGIMLVSIGSYKKSTMGQETGNAPTVGVLPMELEHTDLNLKGARVEFGRVYTDPGPKRLRILYDLIAGAHEYLAYRANVEHASLRSAPIYAEGGVLQSKVYQSLGMKQVYGPAALRRDGRYIQTISLDHMQQVFDLDRSRYDPGRYRPRYSYGLNAMPERAREFATPLQIDQAYLNFFRGEFSEGLKIARRLHELDPTDVQIARLHLEMEIWSRFDFSKDVGDLPAAKKFVDDWSATYIERLKAKLGDDFQSMPSETEAAHFRNEIDIAQEVAVHYQALIAMKEGHHVEARQMLDGVGFDARRQRGMAWKSLDWVRDNANYQDWHLELDRDIYQMTNPYNQIGRQRRGNKGTQSKSMPHPVWGDAVIQLLDQESSQKFAADVDKAR
jgi:hypothetical protein